MQAYVDPDQSSTLDDWSFSLAFAQDQAKYAFPVQAMQPCRNVDCANRSYALFCSEACRLVIEQDEPESAEYYSDEQGVLLGHRQLSDTQWQADQAAGGLAAMVCGQAAPVVAAAVVPPVPAFTEAPISITLKGLVHGVDTMVTIRGADFATVQAQVEAASQWLDTPAAPTAQSTPVETGEGWCAIHTTQMRWNPAKGGEAGWWSHKHDGQWCKGRSKAVRHG